MELKHWLAAPFKFTPIPVSALLVLIYAIVFTSVSVTDETPSLPKNFGGIDLDKAYEDLHIITQRPRPITSHANDDVHDYLVKRLRPIVASQKYIHLSDDLTSNATFTSSTAGGRGTYYEAANILVKIDGTDAPMVDSDGVLFSAHFDSVSTAPGATDNGMSVVTLLQLVEYFSHPKRRPRRTAVFLFNNGEEDGLNGALLYFEHPWSNLTASFINLEGAAAGGRPVLFRSTSLAAVRSFAADGVIHPHGNVLSADAFATGIIRSRTDYQVFEKGIQGEKEGMDGVDFAFYKNRAYYHTKFDSIPGMGHQEARKSLWGMMETARGAGSALLNDDTVHGDREPGVYFDILGHVMVTLSRKALFALHVTFLVIGPLTVLALFAWVLILTRNPFVVESDEPVTPWKRVLNALATVIGWGRFWLSLLITIGVNIGFVAGYVKLDPYVIYSKPYLVLAATLASSFLAFGLSLSLFCKIKPSPPSSQKFAILLEVYLLSWIFLVFGTVLLHNKGVGGVYLITVWNVSAWVAAVLALVEAVVQARSSGAYRLGEHNFVGDPVPPREEIGHRFVTGVRYDAPSVVSGDGENEEIETEPTEITPLIQQQRRRSVGGREYVVGIDNNALPVDGVKGMHTPYEESGWWILQALALIPAPAILLFQIDLQMLYALKNTLADGTSPVIVYGGLSLFASLIFINISPFAHQIHRVLYLLVLIVFVVSLIITWTTFPFAQDAPLKVFFQQSIELNTSSVSPTLVTSSSREPSAGVVRAVTRLTGRGRYIRKHIIPELPSAFGKEITCAAEPLFPKGISTCTWESALIPSPGGNTSALPKDAPSWFSLESTRLNGTAARFAIQGVNTRSCQLTFNHPVGSFELVDSGARLLPGYEVPQGGLHTVMLWSRTWGKKFVVDVAWAGSSPGFKLEGRAGCNWAEYASGTAGSPNAVISGQIPAYEEVLQFLPLWAVSTKFASGLAEVWTKFSV
ncbi:hypothetical protein BDY19DRAFT_938120 [Irpex rosettiformis]|uniref:Uncharacterized protein n=1 Tax=Irpex rosettiformis TaxID=378272 RepID=A0ACB8U993_9APHY|nr:hypothetical protein BDY19DRAFT_938120 [Irpex rosettiformis]